MAEEANLHDVPVDLPIVRRAGLQPVYDVYRPGVEWE
jgi:hypothetical protein